jgi:hypothetical protein
MKEEDIDKACSTHGKYEKCITNFGRKPEGKNHLEDLDIEGRIKSKWILEKQGGNLWSESIWLRTETRSGLL